MRKKHVNRVDGLPPELLCYYTIMAQLPASMFHARTHIREGDIVIVYLVRDIRCS